MISLYIFTRDLRLSDNNALYFCNQNYMDCLDNLQSKYHDIKSITITQDYTPYAIKRQKEIAKFCQQHKIKFNLIEDYLLILFREQLFILL